MRYFRLFGSGIRRYIWKVLMLLCFLLICVGVLFNLILLYEINESRYIPIALLGTAGVVYGAVAFSDGSRWRGAGVFLLSLALIEGCMYFIMSAHPATYDEICQEDGICPEQVVSRQECDKQEGKWRQVDGKGVCYLKWATIQPPE